MDPGATILIVVLPFAIIFGIFSRDYYKGILKRVCETLPLEVTRKGIWETPALKGEVEGVPVEVSKINRHKRSDLLEVKLDISLAINGKIRITRENLVTMVDDLVGNKDIQAGDYDFDRALRLWASYPAEMICLLNADLRRMLLELYRATLRLEIENTHVAGYIKKSIFLETETLVKLIRLCISIAQNLGDKKSLEKRCVENILHDPLVDVKLNNIDALVSRFPLEGSNITALQKALRDPAVEVQAAAAKHLGERGMKHLVKIVDSGAAASQETAVAIVRTLRENDYIAGIPTLKKLYVSREEISVKTSVLLTFARFGSGELGPFLLEELAKKIPDLELHIVKALGSCGGVEAVETLLNLGKSASNSTLRKAVKEAILQIQSRLGDVEKGWLSVTDIQELDGALSAAGEGEPARE